MYNLSDGYLEGLFISEDSLVEKGQILGEIRNALTSENISYQDNLIASLKTQLQNKKTQIIIPKSAKSFGQLHDQYNNLEKQIYEYNQLNNTHHNESIKRLINKIASLKSLSSILKEQIEVGNKELVNAIEQHQIDDKLYKDAVIAKSDWIEKTSNYHQKVSSFQNLKQSLIQNELQIQEEEIQLADLKYKSLESKAKNNKDVELTLTLLQNYKQEWKEKYALVAPISGKINFVKQISAGDFLKSNQPIAYIITLNRDIRAKVNVPYKGFGKIKAGQKARLTLDSYPYQEFGHIYGAVVKISDAPSTDNLYEVIIELPDDLISSFNFKLPYKPNSIGIAEIIIQDYSIFERLIFSSQSTLFNLKKSQASASSEK